MISSRRYLAFDMDIRLFALAMTVLVILLVIRQWKSEILPLVRMAITLTFALLMLAMITPLITYLRRFLDSSALSTYAEPVLKSLGIAILTQCCADICKDCGEGGIANGIELIGKIEILVLSLPLIDDILELAGRLLSLGSS